MNKNIGNTDRMIRLAVAVVLIGLFAANIVTGVLGYIVLAVAAIAGVTALVNFCPLYAILGVATHKVEATAEPEVPMFAVKEDPHKSGGCCGNCGSED